MALTNYLTHTVVALIAFYGIGFGLMGRRRPCLVAADGRRHDLGAGGVQPMVAGALRVRPDGVDLAAGDLRPAPAPPQGGS